MNLRILIWNVRGANNRKKIKIIKSLIKDDKVDLVCLQETKIQEMSVVMVRSLGVGRFLDWVALNSNGAVGGILIFWDNRVLKLLGVEMGEFSLSCKFKNGANELTWVFTGVYGPVVGSSREDFWEELGAIRGLWQDPRYLGGDFNVTRSLLERSGPICLMTTM